MGIGFGLIEQIILGLYIILCLGVGIYSIKFASKSSESFYVADRSMGTLITTWALVACCLSASGMLSNAELTYIFGWAPLWATVGNMLWVFLLMTVISVPMRRFGKLTVPEYFGDRYGSNVKLISIVVILGLYIVFMVAQTYGIVTLISSVYNLPYVPTTIVIVGVFVLYTLFGGMYAAIWTDFFQGILLWIASVVALIGGMMALGLSPLDISGLNAMLAEVASLKFVSTYSDGAFSWQSGLGWIILLGFGVAAQPHIVMRFYTAKDEKVVSRSASWLMVIVCVFFFATSIVGMVAKIMVPEGLTPVLAFPIVLYNALPDWIAAICIAGIISAIMSTVNSVLLVMSAAIVKDLYVAKKPDASEKSLVNLSRYTILVIGIITIVLSLKPPQFLFQVMAFFFGLMASAFFFPLVLGLHWKNASPTGAVAGMLGGIVANIILGLLIGIPANTIYSIIVSLVLTVVVSLKTEKSSLAVRNMVKKTSFFYKS